jgi:hypothetical protein
MLMEFPHAVSVQDSSVCQLMSNLTAKSAASAATMSATGLRAAAACVVGRRSAPCRTTANAGCDGAADDPAVCIDDCVSVRDAERQWDWHLERSYEFGFGGGVVID